MVTRGRSFLARLEESSAKIVAVAQPFLRSARTILVHGARYRQLATHIQF